MKRKEESNLVKQEAYKKRKAEESANWQAAETAATAAESITEIETTNSQEVMDCNKVTEHPANISKMVITASDTDFYSGLPGRRSFGGCNVFVEKEYERFLDSAKFDRAVAKANADTVSDDEMLRRYETLIGLPRGPNQGRAPKPSGAGAKKGNGGDRQARPRKGQGGVKKSR